MITEMNEWKTVTKHISRECIYKFDDRKCNSNQKWNNDKCWCECKNQKEHRVCEKDYNWNFATFQCDNVKYLASVINDSVIKYHEIMGETKAMPSKTIPTKTVSTSFNEKKVNCKIKNFYILSTFLLIAIALLIIVRIYCYLIKYQTKQKHLLPYPSQIIKVLY